ncbi:MAG TPA: succinate--CoA ligase subunit alpha [Caldisericia bacterium]|nr:succinate--CoA ligase subunit alpha [Caldisericia bacterium]HXK51270.1 succinate--CoA ligase subunit alpha [Caldisericia bacterium]
MSILINEKSKVIVQGITGRDGSFHAEQMIQYGTNVVGGVTPGKGGKTILGVPIFDSMQDAVSSTQADVSLIFVPPAYASDAIIEAADAGIQLIVCITEGIPVNQMLKTQAYLATKPNIRLIGPNCPGVVSPGKSKVGILPGHIFKQGNVGVVSRSGTLTYEIVYGLTTAGFGESTCIGIGGDPIIGTDFIDVLTMFNEDPQTESIVLIGEIGGDAEEKAADYIKKNIRKKVVAFIAGVTAPPEKRMGHAGAIISQGMGTAQGKVEAFEKVGVKVASIPSQVADLLK